MTTLDTDDFVCAVVVSKVFSKADELCKKLSDQLEPGRTPILNYADKYAIDRIEAVIRTLEGDGSKEIESRAAPLQIVMMLDGKRLMFGKNFSAKHRYLSKLDEIANKLTDWANRLKRALVDDDGNAQRILLSSFKIELDIFRETCQEHSKKPVIPEPHQPEPVTASPTPKNREALRDRSGLRIASQLVFVYAVLGAFVLYKDFGKTSTMPLFVVLTAGVMGLGCIASGTFSVTKGGEARTIFNAGKFKLTTESIGVAVLAIGLIIACATIGFACQLVMNK